MALHVGRSFAAQILDEESTSCQRVALGELNFSDCHNSWRVALLLDTKYCKL